MDPNSHQYSSGHGHAKKHPPSSSELMASAKLLSEAAKSGFSSESVDKGRVASAAADLLDAACHYGKLEDKPVGKYMDKAETYLHNYHQSHSSPNTTTHSDHNPDHTTTHSGHNPDHTTAHSGHNPDHNTTTDPSSGIGEYVKMGQGLMNSSGSTTAQSSSHGGSGGYGEYFKMAEGFLKKH